MASPRLSRFVSPTEVHLLSVWLDATVVASTVLMPIMLFLIYRAKSMGKYRWYILNSILWDYAYDVTLAVLKPTLFLPVLGG
ncbi:hypothetical protein AAVH_40806, partial [Aphelenchoides avenae]